MGSKREISLLGVLSRRRETPACAGAERLYSLPELKPGGSCEGHRTPAAMTRNVQRTKIMISKTMQEAINSQIKNEFYSAYLYLGMAAYFEANNLPGSAKWMRTQHAEEQAHAMKFFEYVLDRGGRVTLQALDQPPADFESPVAVWDAVVEHERQVSASIHKLYELALHEKDYATQALLTWFITEQVEEEKNATLMAEQFRLAGRNPAYLLMFDGHFTKRGV